MTGFSPRISAKVRLTFVAVDRLIYRSAKLKLISFCGGSDERGRLEDLCLCRNNRAFARGLRWPAAVLGVRAAPTASGCRVSATASSGRYAAARRGIPATAWRSAAAAGRVPAASSRRYAAASRHGPVSWRKIVASGLPNGLAAILRKRPPGRRSQGPMPESASPATLQGVQGIS